MCGIIIIVVVVHVSGVHAVKWVNAFVCGTVVCMGLILLAPRIWRL